MESYLRDVVERVAAGGSCPSEKLQKIRSGVPLTVVAKYWNEVILSIFIEKGDTSYARDGYHNAVNLIEKHLIYK